ncbi:MAG: pyridoxal phosphate-dependent aminotransferase [Phycisphaerales bacterium]|nr:pyridoxal phosphate-dependent aminotransferase [Phycisphaerales bacterium]MCB9857384.1 pyridoxal phosphate-dependent aminotransferase [Phycisphaerales bacterium]
MRLSERAKGITPSATLAVATKAAELKRAGVNVIGFGAGEPDFRTPAHIIAATKAALDGGHTGYAKPSCGIPAAKEAVCEKFRRENGLTYSPSQVIVTLGGKEALALAFAALLDPGDEVLLPVPYWVSFPEQIQFFGGKVVPIVPKGDDLRLTPDQIAAAVTNRTRIFVFNSPSNPGGFAYNAAETKAIAAALADHDLIVFSDEMYDQLRYGDRREHFSFARISDAWYEKTITFNATSKTHAMTGWRLGYAAGPTNIIKAMSNVQSHTTSGAVHFAQYGLIEALTGDQAHVAEMHAAFEKRGAHMARRLNELKGVRCIEPSGAFYCFPDVREAFKPLGVSDGAGFCEVMLEKAHVALVPGDAFGMDTHIRMSFATGMEQIDTGIDRMAEVLGRK